MLWVSGVSAAPGMLAQSPVLATASSKPNIMLVLDDSGSKGWGANSNKVQAKNAAKDLVDTLSNVNVGVGSFYSGGAEVNHAIVDVDKNRASIKKAINKLNAGGGTPLIATMQQMGSYFIGRKPPSSPGNSTLASCTKNGQYTGDLTLHPDDPKLKKNYRANQVIPSCLKNNRQCLQSPICHYCQKNFIVLLTDGWGYGYASSPFRTYRHSGCRGQQLCAVAAGLYDIDLRPDIDTFEGKAVKNSIITYTIGFHTSQALLGDTAREGGGLYIEADNQDALTKAFAKISADIKAHARGSASTASFNTRSLSTATHLYLTRYDTQDWSGDLSATSLTKDGRIDKTQWSASKLLDQQTNHNARVVLSYNNHATLPPGSQSCAQQQSNPPLGTLGGVPFRYDKLSPAQKADLETMPKASSSTPTYTYKTKWSTDIVQQGSIAVDQQSGAVYFANHSQHKITHYDASGTLLNTLGSLGSGAGQMNQPRGVAIDSSSNLWVADTGNHRIHKYNAAGVLQNTFGQFGSANGQFNQPWALAIDSNDNVYVVDNNHHRVQVFDKNGNYLHQWGSQGNGNGQFSEPRGIAIDSQDNVYVTDYQTDLVQKFDKNGTYLLKWGGSSQSANGKFYYAWGIAIDNADKVYVADRDPHRVQVFDNSCTYLTQLGTTGQASNANGQFTRPTGVAIKRGNTCAGNKLYVADNTRIQQFLDSAASGGSNAAENLAKARIAYLRGDRSNEDTKGYKFRKRKSVLGDIVNSTAVYVGAHDLKWPDDKHCLLYTTPSPRARG